MGRRPVRCREWHLPTVGLLGVLRRTGGAGRAPSLKTGPTDAVLPSLASGRCRGRTRCSSQSILGHVQGQRPELRISEWKGQSLGFDDKEMKLTEPGPSLFWCWWLNVLLAYSLSIGLRSSHPKKNVKRYVAGSACSFLGGVGGGGGFQLSCLFARNVFVDMVNMLLDIILFYTQTTTLLGINCFVW